MAQAATERLREHEAELNAMNLSPTPDKDTGSNMVLTMDAALSQPHDIARYSASEAARAMACGAFHHARGASGVILAYALRGVTSALWNNASPVEFAQAIYETVEKSMPVVMEGSMVTLLRSLAITMRRPYLDTLDAFTNAVANARQTVNSDAGSMGLIYLLEGALDYLKAES